MDKKVNSHCIRVYFNEEEYALISEHEKVLGVSKQQLVRKVLIENASPNIINARELLRIFDSLGEKIGASNELIYTYLNTAVQHKPFSVEDEKSETGFTKLLTDYLAELKTLEQAIRLLLLKMKT